MDLASCNWFVWLGSCMHLMLLVYWILSMYCLGFIMSTASGYASSSTWRESFQVDSWVQSRCWDSDCSSFPQLSVHLFSKHNWGVPLRMDDATAIVDWPSVALRTSFLLEWGLILGLCTVRWIIGRSTVLMAFSFSRSRFGLTRWRRRFDFRLDLQPFYNFAANFTKICERSTKNKHV